MLALGRRELLGQPVDRCRGRGHDLADPGVGGGLDDLVGAVDQYLNREPGLGGALGDPDGRLVEHDVDARHQRPDQLPVPDVAVDNPDLPGPKRPGQVLRPAADEVVEDHDLVGARGRQLVDDRRPDRAGTACDQEALPGDHAALPFREIRAPPLSTLRDAASSSLSTRRPACAR